MNYKRVYLSSSEYRKGLLKAVPELDISTNPGFGPAKKKELKSDFLVRLVRGSLLGRYRHEEGFHGEDSFTSRYLTKGLGRDYKTFLKPLYSFVSDNYGYSKDAHRTKQYKLHSWIRTKIRNHVRSYDGKDRIVDENGFPIFRRKWIANGIQCKGSGITVPSRILIGLSTLDHTVSDLISIEEGHLKSGIPVSDVTNIIDQLCELRRWVRTTGGIPNLYKEERTGRLGRLGEFSIVQLNNTVRMLLFRGTGWYDFDFINCHYSIFQSLCSHYGVPTPNVGKYLRNRKKIENFFLSNSTFLKTVGQEIQRDVLKSMFISLLYGGRLAPHPTTANTKKLGRDVMGLLNSFPSLKEMEKEIQHGSTVILDHHPRLWKHTKRVTRNVMGKESTKTKKGSRLSHVITGLERLCLEIACRDFDDTKCVIYDGWISPDRYVTELERKIEDETENETGIRLSLNIKKEKIPSRVSTILSKAGIQ